MAITWRNNKGGTNLLLLEFKFTEPNFGECSKQGNPDQKRFLSSKEIVSSPRTQCYRAEVGRLYWDIILASDSPFRQELLTLEAICPFRYDFYQLMRNQVLAQCIQRDPELNYDKVEFGVMYHADNDKLIHMKRSFDGEKDPIKAWRGLLREPITFHSLTVQQFLGTIETKLPVDLVNWRRYLKEKYLL